MPNGKGANQSAVNVSALVQETEGAQDLGANHRCDSFAMHEVHVVKGLIGKHTFKTKRRSLGDRRSALEQQGRCQTRRASDLTCRRFDMVMDRLDSQIRLNCSIDRIA